MRSAITKAPPISIFAAFGSIIVSIALSICVKNRPRQYNRVMRWFEYSNSVCVIISFICIVPLFIGVLFHIIFLTSASGAQLSRAKPGAGFYVSIAGIVILAICAYNLLKIMSIDPIWPKKKNARGAKPANAKTSVGKEKEDSDV